MLEDIFSVLYFTKINFHRKPLGLLNVNGFYDGLLSVLNQAVEQGFVSQATRHTIISATTGDQLIDQMQICMSEPYPFRSLQVAVRTKKKILPFGCKLVLCYSMCANQHVCDLVCV